MATELGTAYVQIMPSARGISGSISKAIGGEADSAGTMAGTKIGGKMVKAFAAAGVATAVAKVVKESIAQGAQLEQSLGGIETIFGETGKANELVMKNASNAYKTAGISMNQYAENATLFGAAMKKSLGSDVVSAAKLTDVAITSAGDTANKFGMDMNYVIEGYQSLMRGNYQMLDSIAPGYAGTKTGLQQLLTDTASYTKEQQALGLQVDSTSMEFDNIVKALAVYNEHMGVAGTTAKEGTETISGSINMLKSSWTDLMAGMALGNDMGGLVGNVITSVVAVAKNILPAIGNVLSGLGQFIMESLPNIMNSISARLGEWVNSLGSGGGNAVITSVENVLKNVCSYIISTLPGLLQSIVTLLMSLITSAVALIGALVIDGIKAALKKLGPVVSGVFRSAFNAIKQPVVSVMSAVTSRINGAINTIKGAFAKLRSLVGTVRGVFNGIKSAMMKPIEIAISKIKSVLSKIKGFFPIKIGKLLSGIQLPHFKISGSFSIKKKTVPSLSVSWYKKGGIFDSPSVIGVGEAGTEVVTPLDKLQGFIDNAVGEHGTTYNITMNVSGADNPEEWAGRFAKGLNRYARMGV